MPQGKKYRKGKDGHLFVLRRTRSDKGLDRRRIDLEHNERWWTGCEYSDITEHEKYSKETECCERCFKRKSTLNCFHETNVFINLNKQLKELQLYSCHFENDYAKALFIEFIKKIYNEENAHKIEFCEDRQPKYIEFTIDVCISVDVLRDNFDKFCDELR